MSQDFKYRWWALVGVSLLAFTCFLDYTIVTTALPVIQRDLRVSVLSLQWIGSAFALVMTATMIAMGRCGDIYGRRRVYYIGVCVFFLGSIGCAVSPSIAYLIAGRVVQGLGAATVFTNAGALVPSLFPKEEVSKGIGIYSAITGLGMVLGPMAGGVLVHYFSWRAIFFVNVPIIVIGFVLTSFSLKAVPKVQGERVDLVAVLLLALGLGGISVGLALTESLGWADWRTIACAIVGVLCCLLLLRVERRSTHPLLNLAVFTNPYLLQCVLLIVVAGLMCMALLFFEPLFLSAVKDFSPLAVGTVMLAAPAMQVFLALMWGRLMGSMGWQRFVWIAFAASFVAVAWQFGFDAKSSIGYLVVPFLLIGVVWAAGNSGTITVASTHADEKSMGGVIGTIFSMWNFSGTILLVLVSLVFHRSAYAGMLQLLGNAKVAMSSGQYHDALAMIADPSAARAMLSRFGESVSAHLLPWFEASFLHGFRAILWFSLAVILVVVVGYAFVRPGRNPT